MLTHEALHHKGVDTSALCKFYLKILHMMVYFVTTLGSARESLNLAKNTLNKKFRECYNALHSHAGFTCNILA